MDQFSVYCCFVFFQAEDGIRDYKVTGVQTCALPISYRPSLLMEASEEKPAAGNPFVSALTRIFVPKLKSLTKTSRSPFVSLATRLSASLAKATYWPSKLRGMAVEKMLGPSGVRDEIDGCWIDTSSVAFDWRSETKMS